MLATKRGQVLLAEAWEFYDEAIKLLEQGDLRNAAWKGLAGIGKGHQRHDSGTHRARAPQ